MVFAHFHQCGTPLFFVLAGGYQTPIEEKLLPLHLNTFRAAFNEYCPPPEDPAQTETIKKLSSLEKERSA
jgi:hypothetical protein